MEDENKKPEFKMPEMTPEQKAKLDSVGLTVGKLNKMMTPFLFNQLQMIEDGEIHIRLIVKKWDIARIEMNSHLARNLTKEPEGAKES